MLDTEPLHVLVVEDDEDTRANLSDILELDNHHVELAGSVKEALARTDWGDISVILLDRQLPDGSAEEMLPRLKALAPEAAVLIITGFRDIEGALACLRRGAADYLLKPINPELLRANLRRVGQQRQMAAQVRLLTTAVRDVKEGILITDSHLDLPGPRIIFVNEALTQMTGYTAEELVGKSPRIFQSRRTDRSVLERLKDQLLRGKPFTGEVVNRRKDGSEYCVELHISPVFDGSGRVASYVSTQRDVTSRKRAEERMLQAQRLAAIGEMVTGLAHESRNALQRSKACLEMLALEVEDRPEALDLVDRIHKAQNHLHHLYEEVRSYAAPLNLHRESCHLAEVWRDTWSQLEIMRRDKPVLLREEINSPAMTVEGDAFSLGQVFRNIFENAIVACHEPAEVVVAASADLIDGRTAVRVSIRDNGPGLKAEEIQHIFDPFYTTKTKGTGLGMAIAKRIIEAHGGRIAVGKRRSPGAEIILLLPTERV